MGEEVKETFLFHNYSVTQFVTLEDSCWVSKHHFRRFSCQSVIVLWLRLHLTMTFDLAHVEDVFPSNLSSEESSGVINSRDEKMTTG